MRQATSRSVVARGLTAFIIATLFVVGAVAGQAQALRFQVPYQFTVGTKVLPAGKYTFSVNKVWLVVQPEESPSIMQIIITRLSGPAAFLRDGSLVFDKASGSRILSEVWMPGSDGLLLHSTPKDHRREVLLVTDLSTTHSISGKAAYTLTCGRCHGEDGKGDERADKFFNVKIPRLSSTDVQGKLDAELREVITRGTSTMPPVEIDGGGFRHRLPSQDVDAVIAYVRTLKQ